MQGPRSRRLTRLYALLGVLAVVILGGLAITGTAPVLDAVLPSCPGDWSGATRVELGGHSADVLLEGRPYRVGGQALLDNSLRGARSRATDGHPLVVTASITAPSREALGDAAFTCFRVSRGGEIWARRPTTSRTQTLADGYPPGATPPVPNEAWQQAIATDGPEWPDGEHVALELWANVNGRRYVFVIPPFALMRGG